MKPTARGLALLSLALSASSFAELSAVSGTGNGTGATVTARLDFKVKLGDGAFVYLRVGSTGTTIDTASFHLASLAPPGCTATPLATCFGNGVPVNATSNGTVRAELGSSYSTVKLTASNAGLASGVHTMPNSELLLTSNNSNLPIPALGASAGVTLSGIDGASCAPLGAAYVTGMTARCADWTVRYANTGSYPAGVYSGQITFTATSL